MGSVPEHGGETIFRWRKGEPMRYEPILVRLKKGRAREHRQVHGADVVPEARKRELPRLHSASRLALRLDHRDSPALFRQAHGRRQTVVARADYDRVISHPPRVL